MGMWLLGLEFTIEPGIAVIVCGTPEFHVIRAPISEGLYKNIENSESDL